MISYKKVWFLFVGLVFAGLATAVFAETIYVDSLFGRDKFPGTKERPLKTIRAAAAKVNRTTEPGPTIIKIAPGIYSLNRAVLFENKRPYTKQNRLVIESTVLPEHRNWNPGVMPIIMSTEDPKRPQTPGKRTETYSFKIKLSHVTIRGLKFLGNPLANNWHCCLERAGDNLEDMLVTQCVFVGDKNTFDIYCPAIAAGDSFVVDHCIFKNCHASAVFWDGPKAIPGKACAMKYSIVDGGRIAGVWTCRTAEDFQFHHNIVTNCQYFWMRKSGDKEKYQLHDCIVANNKNYSGYGVEAGPIGKTGPEVTFQENNITKTAAVTFVKDKNAKNYLHPAPGSAASKLGAGLFINTTTPPHQEKP